MHFDSRTTCEKKGCIEFGELTGLPQSTCSRCGKPTKYFDWERKRPHMKEFRPNGNANKTT